MGERAIIVQAHALATPELHGEDEIKRGHTAGADNRVTPGCAVEGAVMLLFP
jgi:hypothetical protein